MAVAVTMTHLDSQGLNSLDQDDFVDYLEGIFEHSPWIARRVWSERPFNSVEDLHAAMLRVLAQSSEVEKLGLICAHPELAGKEAQDGKLTLASTGEQRGAGLDQCSKEELQRLRSLNAAYLQKFGFPFVVAVKGLSRYQIMDAAEERMGRGRDIEFQECLHQIGRIARFRLDALFG